MRRVVLSPGTGLISRSGGMGCTNRTSGLGWGGPSLPHAGIGCTARQEGLGALPGPSLMDELIATFSGLAGQFLQLDAEMVAIHNRLLEAVRIAESKQQNRLSSEAQRSVRALANMRSQYLRVRDGLSNQLAELQKLKTDYESGAAGIVAVGFTTARIALQGGLDLRVAHSLLLDVPRFSQNSAALIEQINGATSLEPPTALRDIPGQITGNLAQFAMWVSITAGLVFIVPPLLKAVKRR